MPRKGRGNVNNSQRHLRLYLSHFHLFLSLLHSVSQKISPPSQFKRNLIVFWQKAKAIGDYKASAGSYPSSRKLTWSGYWANNSIVWPVGRFFLLENLLGKHSEKREVKKCGINRLFVGIWKWKVPEQLTTYCEMLDVLVKMRWLCEKRKENIFIYLREIN